MAITRLVGQALDSSRLRPRNNKIALIGHSMPDGALTLSISAGQVRKAFFYASLPGFVGMLSRGRYVFPENCKFAVGSTKTADIISTPLTITNRPDGYGVGKTQLQMAVECSASTVMLWTGRNDAAGSVSLSTIIANFTTILNTLTAAGKTVIMIGPTPSGNASNTANRLTGAALQTLYGVREWMVNQAPLLWPAQVFCADLWSAFADLATSATAGDALSTVAYDGLHPSTYGGWLAAQIVLPMLDRLGLPGSFPPVHCHGEAYDATSNPRGNLFNGAAAQGMLFGTGSAWSSTSGGVTCTGTKPDALASISSGVTGTNAITFTGSMVTNARGSWWQCRVSGTSGAGSNQYTLLNFTSALLSNLSAGDKIAQFGEFEIDQGGTGMATLAYTVQRPLTGNTDTNSLYYSDDSRGSFNSILAAGLLSGTWNGDQPSTIDGTETGPVKHYLQVNVMPSATVDFTFRVRNVALRKVA